jgi:hypothetical protein
MSESPAQSLVLRLQSPNAFGDCPLPDAAPLEGLLDQAPLDLELAHHLQLEVLQHVPCLRPVPAQLLLQHRPHKQLLPLVQLLG